MGICYQHHLVVDDAGWRPQPDTVARVEKVLRAWSLIDQPTEVIDLLRGTKLTPEYPSASTTPGRGIALIYPGIRGTAVEQLAGPSYYDSIGTEDRYTSRVTLIVGDDYRIQNGSHAIYPELIASPIDGSGRAIEPNQEQQASVWCYSDSFAGQDISSPPQVKMHVEEWAKKNIGWGRCNGFWRGALVLDFGKDLPSFAREVHILPARQFVYDLSEAFRGPLAQLGEFE